MEGLARETIIPLTMFDLRITHSPVYDLYRTELVSFQY